MRSVAIPPLKLPRVLSFMLAAGLVPLASARAAAPVPPPNINLDTDLGEKTDVATQHPEVVAKLKALADRQQSVLSNGSAKGPGVRAPSRVTNPQFLYPVSAAAPKKAKKQAAETE